MRTRQHYTDYCAINMTICLKSNIILVTLHSTLNRYISTIWQITISQFYFSIFLSQYVYSGGMSIHSEIAAKIVLKFETSLLKNVLIQYPLIFIKKIITPIGALNSSILWYWFLIGPLSLSSYGIKKLALSLVLYHETATPLPKNQTKAIIIQSALSFRT